ncbi:hypothetical protein DKG34_21915 [Streptomyces sp. NWU49]|nr:hypothetical protein DKG34_21915 [Streptomyces sp. NWU49]
MTVCGQGRARAGISDGSRHIPWCLSPDAGLRGRRSFPTRSRPSLDPEAPNGTFLATLETVATHVCQTDTSLAGTPTGSLESAPGQGEPSARPTPSSR